MIDREFANRFADAWLSAWNAHDLDRILEHYADDFEMNSPLIVKRMGIPEGRLQGKLKIREYWSGAFKVYPDLKFILKDVLFGVSSITIYYTGATGGSVAETFLFDNKGKVVKAYANYAQGAKQVVRSQEHE